MACDPIYDHSGAVSAAIASMWDGLPVAPNMGSGRECPAQYVGLFHLWHRVFATMEQATNYAKR